MAGTIYPAYVGVLICIFIADRILKYVVAARFKKAHGCKPEPKLRQFERILGIGVFKAQMKAKEEKRLLEVTKNRFDEIGNTWSASVMGTVFTTTIEPENIKAVLATNFKDFGLGRRILSFGPLLGSGIFTSDGAAWEHSRVSTFSVSRDIDGLILSCRRW